jgi:regulator of sirC expression with transglutaminase-like and TPR domain
MRLDVALSLLAREPAAPLDLAELALLLAQDEYPQLDVEAYLNEVAGMAHDARAFLHGGLHSQVRGLCRYLFHDMGFRGNANDYYSPRNSYLNEVLDRRTGIPLTLSTVAIAVAGRAGLEVVGIGLPGHFIAKAVRGTEEVLFDPYHGGRILTPGQCEVLVEQLTGEPFTITPELLQAMPLGRILLRLLTNLKGAHLRQGDFPRTVRVIERLRQLQPEDLQQQRDLGAVLVQMGSAGRAIPHLRAYLEGSPDADDAAVVRQVLRQAQHQVALWN